MAGNPFLLNEPDVPRSHDTELLYGEWFKVADAGVMDMRCRVDCLCTKGDEILRVLRIIHSHLATMPSQEPYTVFYL